MLKEYSYDSANEVIRLFKDGILATLNITKVEKDDTNVFVMEYTKIDEYSDKHQYLIRKLLSESLPQRLNLISVLNLFMENQIVDNVEDFSLHFDIANTHKCDSSYSYKFKQATKTAITAESLVKNLENFETLATKMGVCDATVEGIFVKGKGKKYSTPTLLEVIDALRHSLMEG